MVIDTPFGLLRLEPLRWLRRAWLWLTAPASSRLWTWSDVSEQSVQLRSMSDSELWIRCAGAFSPSPSAVVASGFYAFQKEVQRRSLPASAQWLEAAQMMYPDAVGMRIAERVFRP